MQKCPRLAIILLVKPILLLFICSILKIERKVYVTSSLYLKVWNSVTWFNMRMSEEELNALLSNNPSVRVREFTRNIPDTIPIEKAPSVKASPSVKSAKYRNKKVYVYDDGYTSLSKDDEGHGLVSETFDSQKEYHRYTELRQLERAGEIKDLKRQVPINIMEAFEYQGEAVKAIIYKADFMYYLPGENNPVVEDAKGIDSCSGKARVTPEFAIKWKLLKHKYPDWKFVVV